MTNILNFKETQPLQAQAEPYLVFTNPGILDINLVKLLGVSVKESENAIGFFGTGLKYALACTLRLGGSITIFSDGVRYDVSGEAITLRDKAFTRVTINGEALGFTTELGKQWTAWMVVRELYSNALDERGFTSVGSRDMDDLTDASHGKTIIALSGEEFMDVWSDRASYFIAPDEQPVVASDHAEGYSCGSDNRAVFYRGIRVYDSPKPTLLRYNLKQKIVLTEDRTAKYLFEVTEAIERAIITSEDHRFIAQALTSGENYLEGNLPFNDGSLQSLPMSEAFQTVCRALAERQPMGLNKQAIKYYQGRTQHLVPVVKVALSPLQTKQLDKAVSFLKSLGFCDALDDYPIEVVSWLGERIYGQAKDGKIFLTKQAFDTGTKKLAAIILEEFVHNHFNLYDESREMQSWLFERIVTMGEEHVTGEPL